MPAPYRTPLVAFMPHNVLLCGAGMNAPFATGLDPPLTTGHEKVHETPGSGAVQEWPWTSSPRWKGSPRRCA
jgi:hypothetical protein